MYIDKLKNKTNYVSEVEEKLTKSYRRRDNTLWKTGGGGGLAETHAGLHIARLERATVNVLHENP